MLNNKGTARILQEKAEHTEGTQRQKNGVRKMRERQRREFAQLEKWIRIRRMRQTRIPLIFANFYKEETERIEGRGEGRNMGVEKWERAAPQKPPGGTVRAGLALGSTAAGTFRSGTSRYMVAP
jgi:hypothetical protein